MAGPWESVSVRRWRPSIWPLKIGYVWTPRRCGGGCCGRRYGAASGGGGDTGEGESRKEHFGELVQMDGSFHPWLEERGPGGCLMDMADDATNTTWAQLGEQETI